MSLVGRVGVAPGQGGSRAVWTASQQRLERPHRVPYPHPKSALRCPVQHESSPVRASIDEKISYQPRVEMPTVAIETTGRTGGPLSLRNAVGRLRPLLSGLDALQVDEQAGVLRLPAECLAGVTAR